VTGAQSGLSQELEVASNSSGAKRQLGDHVFHRKRQSARRSVSTATRPRSVAKNHWYQ
jgi:hypothetical protein